MASYFVRVKADDKTAVYNSVNKIFGDCSFITIENPKTQDEVAFVTPEHKEAYLQEAIAKIKKLSCVHAICSIIRVEKG